MTLKKALYIVATPIGNRQDMSFRAIEVLKDVACIAAEDTRHSAGLLQQFGIGTPVISLHNYNEREKTNVILQRIQAGEAIAVISDAGTPLISDPGYRLVKEARDAGISIIPVPGPCAAIAALSASGLPTDKFVFEGFLPAKNKARLDRLTELMDETRTLIFYEAPHRILNTLQAMQQIFGGDREAVLAREITKVYETIFAAPLQQLVSYVENDSNQQRGELVVLIKGAELNSSKTPVSEILQLLLDDLPVKKAVEIAAKLTSEKKNELYDVALRLKTER